MMRQRRYPLAALASLVLLLDACSSMPVPGSAGLFGQGSLAPEAGDPCSSERASFANSQSFFANDIVSETMMGSARSMFTGVVGRMSGGPASGTNIVQDAFSGARAGYLSAMAKRSSGNRAEMVQQMGSDLRQENTQVDALHSTFQRLQSCRFQQARLIKTRARSGRLTPGGAREELAMQRKLFNEELAKAQQSSTNMESRDEQFQYAAQELNHSGTAAGESGQAKRATEVASVTLPRKRDSFVSAVSDAEVRSKSDLSDDIAAS